MGEKVELVSVMQTQESANLEYQAGQADVWAKLYKIQDEYRKRDKLIIYSLVVLFFCFSIAISVIALYLKGKYHVFIYFHVFTLFYLGIINRDVFLCFLL